MSGLKPKNMQVDSDNYALIRRDNKFYDITLKENDTEFHGFDFWDPETRKKRQTQAAFIEGFSISDIDAENKVDPEEEARLFNQKLEAEFAEGYQRGFEEGHKNGSNKVAPLVAALNQTIVDVIRSKEMAYKEVEKQIVQFAMSIAEKVLNHELATNSAQAAEVAVHRALAEISFQGEIEVFLNPSDMAVLREQAGVFDAEEKEGKYLKLIENHEVGVGDCIVRTNDMEVRSNIAQNFERIVQELRQTLSEAESA